MTKQLSPLRRKDIETGRKLEREAIVKWLRSASNGDETIKFANLFADEIKAGKYLK